LTVAAVDAD